jgi:hypothetical protein
MPDNPPTWAGKRCQCGRKKCSFLLWGRALVLKVESNLFHPQCAFEKKVLTREEFKEAFQELLGPRQVEPKKKRKKRKKKPPVKGNLERMFGSRDLSRDAFINAPEHIRKKFKGG